MVSRLWAQAAYCCFGSAATVGLLSDRIDPASGRVTGWLVLEELLSAEERKKKTDVLDGIGHDPEGHRFFVTGKHWPKLFDLKL